MYELFILGELKDKPKHGYLLHRILSDVVGPLRQISWGTLYAVIRRLEGNGLITQVAEDIPGSGRLRKVYAITERGDEQFYHLMKQPFQHNSETEDMFRVKLSKFEYIDADLRLEILRQYRTFLEVAAGGIDVAAQQVQSNPNISETERPNILSVIDYEATVCDAKLSWVERQLARPEVSR